MKTNLILPSHASLNWNIYGPMIQEALDTGQNETPLTEWLRRLIVMEAQLWEFRDDENNLKGVGLTQFIQYFNHKTLHLVFCTGEDWESWSDQYYLVEEFAKNNQCSHVETWGRAGWGKILPKQIPGFYTAYHVMRKKIDYETENKEKSHEAI